MLYVIDAAGRQRWTGFDFHYCRESRTMPTCLSHVTHPILNERSLVQSYPDRCQTGSLLTSPVLEWI